jgi:hypothetical protein
MEEKRFQELMADELGGEIAPADREALLAELRSSPRRRDEFAALREAADALAATALSESEASRRAARLTLESAQASQAAIDLRSSRSARRRAARRPSLALLRYAAAIAIAFGAGFAARGRVDATGQPTPPRAARAPAGPIVALGGSEALSGLADRYVNVRGAMPQASSLSQALLALARR